MHHPTDMITHTTAFVTPVVEHRLEREIAQWGCGHIFEFILFYYILIFVLQNSRQFPWHSVSFHAPL